MKLKIIILILIGFFCFAKADAQVVSENLFVDTTKKAGGKIYHQFKVSDGIVILGRLLQKKGYMNGITKLDTAGNMKWTVFYPDSILGGNNKQDTTLDPRYGHSRYPLELSSPVMDKDENLYFLTSRGSDSSVVNCIKLNTKDGAKIWEQRVAKRFRYSFKGTVFLLDNNDSTFLLERKGEANISVSRLSILKKTNGEITPIKSGLTNLSLHSPALLVDKARKAYYYTEQYKLYKLELVNDSFRILWTKDYTNNKIGTIGNVYVDSLGRGYIWSYYEGAWGVSELYQLIRFDVNSGNILKTFPVDRAVEVRHIIETNTAMYFFGVDRPNRNFVEKVVKFDKLADSIVWNKPYIFSEDERRSNTEPNSSLSFDIDTQGFLYVTGYRVNPDVSNPGFWAFFKINPLDGSTIYARMVRPDSTIIHKDSQGKGIYCFENKVLMVGELQTKDINLLPVYNATLNMTFAQFNPENGNLLKVKPLEGYYQDSSKVEQILMTSDRVIVVKNLGFSIQVESYNLDKRLLWKKVINYGFNPLVVVSPTGNIGLIIEKLVCRNCEDITAGAVYSDFRALALDKNGKVLWDGQKSREYEIRLNVWPIPILNINNSELYFNDSDTSILVFNKLKSDADCYKFSRKGERVSTSNERRIMINSFQDSIPLNYLRFYYGSNYCFNMTTLATENCSPERKYTIIPNYDTNLLHLKDNRLFVKTVDYRVRQQEFFAVVNTKTGDTLWSKRFPLGIRYWVTLKLAADNEQKYVYALIKQLDSVLLYKFNLQNGNLVQQKLVFIENKKFDIQAFAVSPSNNRLIITGNVSTSQYGGIYSNGFIRVIDSSGQMISQEIFKGEEKGDNSLSPGIGFFSDSTFWVGGKVSKIVQGKAAVIYESKLSNQLKTVTGKVYLDLNGNNSVDSTDIALPNAIITSKKSKNFTITDTAGYYTLYFDAAAQDTILANVDIKNAVINPTVYSINSSDSLKNFAVKLPANTQDLRISLTEITPLRSGFNNFYYLNYKNIGSKVMNGRMRFYEPSVLSIISTSPISYLRDSLSVYWDFNNLKPNEERVLIIYSTVRRGVINGAKFNTIASIDPVITDAFKKDNVDTLNQIVVGSYDPNDKQVTYNGSKTPPSVIDASTELMYTIRFQNTGTYRADFVEVIDTLSDKLDLTTFRAVASSHPYTVSLPSKNVLSFNFNPIYLPDSTSDEKGSHGFIKFAIKPKKTLTTREVIKNTGYIYFDYNPAIITNTVESANPKINGIFTPSVSALKLDIFPNPTGNIINIKIDDTNFKEGTLSIYDLSGRLMLTKFITNQTSLIQVDHLNTGEYICTIKSNDNKVFVNKFVKL